MAETLEQRLSAGGAFGVVELAVGETGVTDNLADIRIDETFDGAASPTTMVAGPAGPAGLVRLEQALARLELLVAAQAVELARLRRIEIAAHRAAAAMDACLDAGMAVPRSGPNVPTSALDAGVRHTAVLESAVLGSAVLGSGARQAAVA